MLRGPLGNHGANIVAMGGLSGGDPRPMSPTRLAELVADGDLRFVLTGGGGFGGAAGFGSGDINAIVADACTEVATTDGLYDGAGRADAIAGAGP